MLSAVPGTVAGDSTKFLESSTNVITSVCPPRLLVLQNENAVQIHFLLRQLLDLKIQIPQMLEKYLHRKFFF